jgi:hypothetical protein
VAEMRRVGGEDGRWAVSVRPVLNIYFAEIAQGANLVLNIYFAEIAQEAIFPGVRLGAIYTQAVNPKP